MKIRLLLVILISCVNIGFTQQVLPPTGSPNSLSTFRGAVQIDGAIFVPNGDGSFFTRYSDFIRENGVLKYWDGIEYVAIGSGSIDVEVDPTVPQFVKDITQGDINRWDENHLQNLGLSGQSLSISDGNSVTLQKSNVGLSNVDNTSDLSKPISTATQTALNNKENSFSKNTAFNKNFGTTSGTVKEGDWQPTWSEVTGKPTFSDVAVSGDYEDLSNKPENLSDFNNDEGFATELWVQSQGFLTSAPPTNLGSSVSGNNVTITSSTGTSTTFAVPNTTYTAGTLPILNTGTSTTNQIWNAKVLNDWLTGKNYLVTELDPTVPIWVKNITQTNITNWNNKLSSGDNVSELVNDAGYLTSYAETDPTVPSHVKAITTANITQWNAAQENVQSDWNATTGDALILNKPTIPTNNNQLTNGAGYITSSALSGYVQNSRTLTINGQTFDLSADRTWTIPNDNTITRLRGTATGTYQSGDLTLLAGTNTTITQSGSNITINSTDNNTTYSAGTGLSLSGTTFNNTAPNITQALSISGNNLTLSNGGGTVAIPNTTYTNMTLSELNAGTVTTGRIIAAKTLNDWLNAKGFTTNAGTVTSVGLQNIAAANPAFTILSSPVTGSGILTMLWQGGSNQYVNGEGSLVDFPTIPTYTAGTNIQISGTNVISATNTNTTYTAGNGLSLTGTTFANTAPNATHTGDVTGSTALTIANSAVTHAKYQNIATQRILGRGTAGSGNVEELTLGANLNLTTAGVLSATNTNTTYTSSNGIVLTGTNFAPNYGTGANTIAQGNDTRINNGQTAFSWGNHAGRYLERSPSLSNWDSPTGGTAHFMMGNLNGPISGNAHGIFIPHQSSGGYGSELSLRNNGFYFRSLENNVWRPWLQVADRSWVLSQLSTPNFHQVTTVGNTTTNEVLFTGGTGGRSTRINSNGFNIISTPSGGHAGGLQLFANNGTDVLGSIGFYGNGPSNLNYGFLSSGGGNFHSTGARLKFNANGILIGETGSNSPTNIPLTVQGLDATTDPIAHFQTTVAGAGLSIRNLSSGSGTMIPNVHGASSNPNYGLVLSGSGSNNTGGSGGSRMEFRVYNADRTSNLSAGRAYVFRNGSSTDLFVMQSNGQATFSHLSGSGVRMVTAAADGTLSTQAIPTFQGTNLGSSVSGNNVTITSSTGNNTTFTVPQPPAISQWFDDMGYGYEGNHEPQGGFDTKGGYASRSQMTTSSSSVATDVEYVYFVGGSAATLTLPNPDEYPNRVINISNNSESVYSFTGHIPRVTQSREVGYLDPYDMSAVDSPNWIEIKSVDNPFDTPGEFVWMVVKYGR